MIRALSSVRGRIIAGIGLMVVILVAVAAGSAWQVLEHRSTTAALQQRAEITFLLLDAQANAESAATAVQRYVVVGEDEVIIPGNDATLLSLIDENVTTVVDDLSQAIVLEKAAGHEEDVAVLIDILVEATALVQGSSRIIVLRQSGNVEEAAAAFEEIIPTFREFESNLNEAADTERAGALALREDADRAAALALWILAISGGLGVALGLMAAVFISRSILRPLSSLESTALAVAAGDLEARAQSTGPRELAQLGASFNTMTESLLDASKRLELEKEREQAYAQLRKYSQLVENSNDFIAIASLDGKIQFVNKAGRELVGLDANEDVESKMIAEFLTEEGFQASQDIEIPAVQTHGNWSGETTLRHFRTGSAIPVLVNSFLIKDSETGAPLGLATVQRDITERKQAERTILAVRDRLQLSIDRMPVSYIVWDTNGKVTYWNPAAERIFGFTCEEAVGRMLLELVVPEEVRPVVAEVLDKLVAGEEASYSEPGNNLRKDGAIISCQWFNTPLIAATGEVSGVLSMALDVTEHQQAEEALRESERLLLESQSVAQVGSYVLDIHSGVWKSSPVLDRIFGIGENYERSVESWLALVHPDDRQSMNDHFAHDVVEEHGRFDREYRVVRHDDGTERWVLGLGELEFDAHGRPLRMVGTIQDVTKRKQAAETIRHLAYHDALTGLPNRTLFEDRLTLALAQVRRKEQLVAVMFLDLDRFKVVNDTVGHTFGDQLLRDVAERLTGLVREGDTVARMGGDEFTVLLPEVSQAGEAVEIAERILETLRQPWRIDNREYHVTTSIGIAIYPSDGEDAESLIRNADTAMYRAKEQGRDNFELYTPTMNAKIVERLALENSLRHGLERDEFVVHYQPQVDISSGRIIGTEALVRWQHPERGFVSPMEFIPAAEETGLIVPLGAWVLQTACAQNVAWQQAGHTPIPVAVNLSARQFQERNLLDAVTKVLEESGMDPQYLQFEITEGVAMQDVESTATTLRALREMGVQIAIDDFGTGYSSLSYLRSFPVSALKIDRSFVRGLTVNPEDAAITAAIIAMAKSLKLKVIAEGVETEEQLAFLKEHGCDKMQGFLFSKPVPAPALEKLLAGNSRLQALALKSG